MAKATTAIYFRMPQNQASLLRKAAKMERKSLNAFIRDAAVTVAAERVVRDQPLRVAT